MIRKIAALGCASLAMTVFWCCCRRPQFASYSIPQEWETPEEMRKVRTAGSNTKRGRKAIVWGAGEINGVIWRGKWEVADSVWGLGFS